MIDVENPPTDRGQAFTLEGLVAGLVLVAAIMFALQAVVVTPATPGADVGPDVRQQGTDVLDIAEREGALDDLLRNFNDNESTFAGAKDDVVGYGSEVPDGTFGELLDGAFVQRGQVVNVIIEFRAEDGIETETIPLIYRGEPPDAATVATTTVTLYSDQHLTGPEANDTTLAEASAEGAYPIPNIDPDGPIHNVVTIRVVVW